MCAASTWSLETAVSTPALTNFRDEWRDLLESYDDIFSLYQSPEWFNHMRAGQNGWQHSLATRRDAPGRLSAIVPFYITQNRCLFPMVLGPASPRPP